jgi:hypothetical protein
MTEVHEFIGILIVSKQTSLVGPYPNETFPVLIDRRDFVAFYFIRSIVRVEYSSGVPIVSDQSGPRTNPKEAFAVLKNAIDRTP